MGESPGNVWIYRLSPKITCLGMTFPRSFIVDRSRSRKDTAAVGGGGGAAGVGGHDKSKGKGAAKTLE